MRYHSKNMRREVRKPGLRPRIVERMVYLNLCLNLKGKEDKNGKKTNNQDGI
jgi:hypothetical protein